MSKEYRYKEVEIDNFLVFYGEENKITFPADNLITILNGENMTGKTSLLKFFYWMLFSDNDISSSFNIIKELIPTKEQSTNPLSYMNHLSKNEDVDRIQVGGKLLLEIQSEKSKKSGEYEISKYLIFEKDSSGNIKPVEFKIIIIDPEYVTLNKMEIKNFFTDIRNDFPQEIRNFIFIPSETLGNLFTEKYYGQIREFSIHRSELPFLDKIYNLVDLFVMLCKYFIKREENKTDKLREINTDIEKIEGDIIKKEEEMTKVNKLIDDLKSEVKILENEILTLFKNKATRDEWNEISKAKKSLEKQLESKNDEISIFLKNNSVKIYLYSEMCEIKKDLDLKKDFPHFFDKNIALSIIYDIKNKNLKDCPICGSSLDENKSISYLKDYINRLVDKEGADTEIAIKFKTKLKEEIKKVEENIEVLKTLYEKRESIKKDLAEKVQNEKSLSSKLSDEEKSKDYAKTYENKTKQRNIKEKKIRTQNTKLSKITLEIEELKKDKNKKISKKEKTKTDREKISTEEGKWKFVKDNFIKVRRILDSLIRPDYENKIKLKILKNTKAVCQYIFDIDYDSFEIKINEIHVPGDGKKIGWMIEFDEGLYDKSNGQEIILIISYIISILNTLDIKIPLFLDGPFSVLDDPFSARLATILSKLGKKQQFIITLLNKILTDQVKLNLKENECNKYCLVPEVKRYKSKIERLPIWV